MRRETLLLAILFVFVGAARAQQPTEFPTCDANGPSTVDSRIAMEALGLDTAMYKAAGLCKLNKKELTTLIFSTAAKLNGPEPLHAWDISKPESMKHTYVRVLFEDATPEVVKSAFLSRLRSIPDIVIVYGGDEDVVVSVVGVPVKANERTIGAAWSVHVYRHWRYSPFHMLLEESYADASVTAFSPLDDIDRVVQEDVATINTKCFEVLRGEKQSNNPK